MRLLLTVALAAGGGVGGSDPRSGPGLDQAPVEAPEDEDDARGTDEAGHGSVEVRLGLYDHSDGGGNPFLDEELTVIEPVVVFDYALTDRLGLSSTVSYDYVSSASIDRLSNFPDQSGASGDFYYGFDLGLDYRSTDELTLAGHGGVSFEYDYTSIAFGGSMSLEPDPNSRFALAVDGHFDTIDEIRFDGTETGTDQRTSLAATGTWYQAIDPTTHGELGATLAVQQGFLETPYNAFVVLDPTQPPNANLDNMARGFEITEELPDQRVRGAVFGRVRRGLRFGQALELGGRLYGDSWDVFAASVEPRLYQRLSERWRTRLRYRYYRQTEARDFDDSFSGMMGGPFPEHRTQDSDLGAFDSHTAGVKFTWDKSRAHRFDIGVDYVMRSDDIDQVAAFLGWKWSF